MSDAEIVDLIFDRFRRYGDDTYHGEQVSLSEHMLQSAQTAEEDDAPPELVAAALLHDVGHLADELLDDPAAHGEDGHHEDVAHSLLAQYFPPSVVEPIRMHVAAKRYLCAVEPDYLAALSPASRLSLRLQGGPFDPEEVAAFEASEFAAAAVRLRRYDDTAKIPGAPTPALEHYRPILEAVMTPVPRPH